MNKDQEPEDLRDQQLSFDYHEWQIDRRILNKLIANQRHNMNFNNM